MSSQEVQKLNMKPQITVLGHLGQEVGLHPLLKTACSCTIIFLDCQIGVKQHKTRSIRQPTDEILGLKIV